MKKTKVLLACVSALALLGSSSVGFAGNRPGAFTLNLSDGYYFFAKKRNIENASAPNFALGYDFTDKWGMEAGAAVINTDSSRAGSNQGVHGFIYTIDGIYRFAKNGRLEPYVLAGPGVTALKPAGNEPVNQANINAGIGTQYFIDDSIAFRGEAKDIYTFPGGKNDVMLTAGLTFLFGGTPAAEPVPYKGQDQ